MRVIREMEVRIARYHNVFGPEGFWGDGREKAPAALCRKVAAAPGDGYIEVWGDGNQTRDFLYVDECLEGSIRLMRSNFQGAVNIGSDEMISINGLATMVMEVANKPLSIRHIPGQLGVRGRNSDNRLIQEKLCWSPSRSLHQGVARTYPWIARQVRTHGSDKPRSVSQLKPAAHTPVESAHGAPTVVRSTRCNALRSSGIQARRSSAAAASLSFASISMRNQSGWKKA